MFVSAVKQTENDFLFVLIALHLSETKIMFSRTLFLKLVSELWVELWVWSTPVTLNLPIAESSGACDSPW